MLLGLSISLSGGERDAVKEAPKIILPKSEEEAKVRAQILHDTIHATLQLVHRDFFDPLEMDLIPSATLDEVFEEIEEKWAIEIRWLGVEGKTMSVDHKPRDKFEKKAAEALAKGAKEFESMEGRTFRRAAPIVLHNACLKCHVPNRTSLEDRVAGLVISMALAQKEAAKK
ncbi:DUF3365 domain-containing protein [Verrucomicrobiaceae bacterium 227]